MIYQFIYNTFPIGISLVPSSTKILAMYPSSDASNPIVALSVSISASRSPSDTLSPTFFCHLLIVPVSIVGDRAGSTTLTWLGKSTRVKHVSTSRNQIYTFKLKNKYSVFFVQVFFVYLPDNTIQYLLSIQYICMYMKQMHRHAYH